MLLFLMVTFLTVCALPDRDIPKLPRPVPGNPGFPNFPVHGSFNPKIPPGPWQRGVSWIINFYFMQQTG